MFPSGTLLAKAALRTPGSAEMRHVSAEDVAHHASGDQSGDRDDAGKEEGDRGDADDENDEDEGDRGEADDGEKGEDAGEDDQRNG